MASDSRLDTLIHMELADETATEALARALAALARPGDVLALKGDLGTGKTTFARAFIHARDRAHGGSGDEEVPSPTFTLVQTYEVAGARISHFDLFRIERPEDADELGLDDAVADGIALIEWPERLGSRLPARRLEIALAAGARPDSRRVSIAGDPTWRRRLKEAGLV